MKQITVCTHDFVVINQRSGLYNNSSAMGSRCLPRITAHQLSGHIFNHEILQLFQGFFQLLSHFKVGGQGLLMLFK